MQKLVNPHEEGAVATMSLFAITFLLLAVTMLAIDLGSVWVSRRGQIADADSAAQAAAQLLLQMPCPTSSQVNATADELITANGASTTRDGDVTVSYIGSDCMSRAGTVTVATTTPANLFFAPLFGIDSAETGATSTVAFGQVQAAVEVRPLGICSADEHYQEFLEFLSTGAYPSLDGHVLPGQPPYTGAENPVHRIMIDSVSEGPCATPSENGQPGGRGNWGLLDFDGNKGDGSGIQETVDDILNGYPGVVDLGLPGQGDEDCTGSNDVVDAPCPPKVTEAGGNKIYDALNDLQPQGIRCAPETPTSECESFYVVVYSALVPGPNGQMNGGNARYDLHSLARVVLRGVGSEEDSKGPNARAAKPNEGGQITGKTGDYLDIEFVDVRAEGTRVGAVDPNSSAPLFSYQCGVDGFMQSCDDFLNP